MTESKRRAKIALLQNNMTFADLARASGLALATVHNILDSKTSSRRSRQAITNALGVQIFADVPVTERGFVLRVGTIVHWPWEGETAEFLAEIGEGNGVEIRPNYVKIIKETSFKLTVVADDDPRASRLPPDAGPIDIWCPEIEGEALAEADNLQHAPATATPTRTKRKGTSAVPRR